MMYSLLIVITMGAMTYFYRIFAIPAMTRRYYLPCNSTHLVRRITLLEVLSILSIIMLQWYFPFLQSKWHTILGAIFTWGLLTMSYVDAYYLIIPNIVVKPLWVLGMIANITNEYFASKQSACLGSLVGYSSLLLIANIYQRLTNRVGLGGGDIKLFALGAWLGIEALPFVLWIASSSGLCSGIIWLLVFKKQYYAPLPFGPFLSLGGWIYLLAYKTL